MQKSGELWINVTQSEREQIKDKLPQVALAEPSFVIITAFLATLIFIFFLCRKLVRHSSARVIAAIASIELPLGQWTALLPLIDRCCKSSAVHERELGTFVLFTVLESIVEGFQEYVPQLFSLFETLLQDPQSAEVRVTAVRALGVIAQYISADEKSEIKSFQSLIPAMIAVIQQCLEGGDEQGARQLFDVFETLLILEVPLLSKHIPPLVQFFLQCGATRNYDDELRIMALNALSWTVK